MQRIISHEISRSSNFTSEFVTKRLCCSFILSVAFFAVVGGFFLGRFTAEQAIEKMELQITEITRKLATLDKNLQGTFHDIIAQTNCSVLSMKINCDHFKIISLETALTPAQQLLDVLNDCFNNG